MAYDELIDEKIRNYATDWNIETKRMFGGICYLINGNMMCGLNSDGLLVRLGEAAASEALQSGDVVQAAPAGRPMKGWITVPPDRLASDEVMKRLIDSAREFVAKLPPKKKKT